MNEIKRDIERAENQAFRDAIRKSKNERKKAIREIEKIAKILQDSLDFDIAIWDDKNDKEKESWKKKRKDRIFIR